MPELQCGELSGMVLQLKSLGVDNVMAFDYLAPPPAEAMVKAAELLYALGAIDDKSRCVSHGTVVSWCHHWLALCRARDHR